MDSPRSGAKSSSGRGPRGPFTAFAVAGLAVFLTPLLGCGDDAPLTTTSFRIVGPPTPLANGSCPTLFAPTPATVPGAQSVRLTYRARDEGPLVCDVVVPLDGTRRVVAIPAGAQAVEPIDIWVEYLSATGATLATGVTYDVSLNSERAVDIRVTPVGAFSCAPEPTRTERAFHTATLLPTGEVLIAGGLVADPTGATTVVDLAGKGALYATSELELYNPVTGEIRLVSLPDATHRAFHEAIVVSTDPIQIALYGGITVNGDPSQTPIVVAGSGGMLRIMPATNAVVAPTEILTYDPEAVIITRQVLTGAAPRGLMAAAGPRGQTDTPPVIAGGWRDASAAEEVLSFDVLDPLSLETTSTGATLWPRVGATISAVDNRTALVWGGAVGSTIVDQLSSAAELLVGLDATAAAQAVTYNPASTAPTPRTFHKAVTLSDGSIIVVGGFAIDMTGNALVPEPVFAQRVRLGAELLISNVGTAVGTTTIPVGYLDAVVMDSGDALITGGNPAIGDSACVGPADVTGLRCSRDNAYRYVTGAASFESTGPLVMSRYGHRTTVLPDRTVLVTGGFHAGFALAVIADAEIYDGRDSDPIADLAPAITRAANDVARYESSGEPVAECVIITPPAE